MLYNKSENLYVFRKPFYTELKKNNKTEIMRQKHLFFLPQKINKKKSNIMFYI